MSYYIDLLQIIVYSDQLSGKSSTLEAILGISFLAKDNLYTRFATKLILRHTLIAGIDISISLGFDRTEDEQATLEAFTYIGTLKTFDLRRIIDNAKNTIGLNEASKVFSTDVLHVEVSSLS